MNLATAFHGSVIFLAKSRGFPDFILSCTNNFQMLKDINILCSIDWNQVQIVHGTNRLMDLYGTSKRTEDRDPPSS
jgi:hypothetical protein